MSLSEALKRLRQTSTRANRMDAVVATFLALVFGFSSLDKFVHLHGFITAIDSYRILPVPMGSTLAPLVIAAELTVAAGLAWRPWRGTAALQAALMTLVFTVATVANRMTGATEICGCWFSLNMARGELHLVFNVALIILSLLVWLAHRRPSPIGHHA